MKPVKTETLIILIGFVLCMFACRKTEYTPAGISSHDSTIINSSTSPVPFPVNPQEQCNFAPYYGDSIVYPQPSTNGDYYVYPKTNQNITGTYLSWPAGLAMDAKSGAIDLTKSETGQRYAVGFVQSGTTDTCLSQLIVAGVAYVDSVYNLTNSTITAAPYFNANPGVSSPCSGNQGPGCTFDYNHLAQFQGIIVDNKTGYIDLVQTMSRRPFGLFPYNGKTINTTIYYMLDDNSNNAAQSIQLQLVYYNRKSDVPANLQSLVTNNLINTLNNTLLGKGPSPRPPLVIIVRSN